MRGTTPDGTVGSIIGFLTLLAVLPVFSLSLPLSFMFGTPSVWGFGEKYGPSFSFTWSKFMTEFVMGVQLKLVGNRGLHKDGKCVYLCNHRAWADFFIDMYLTEGRGFILSRYLVVYVFPLFAVPAMAVGAVFAFKRNKPGAHEELNKQLDQHRETYSDYTGIVVYPEGTRNIKPRALPLKRGLIKYTWSRQLDVQIIIAADKEHVLSQKRGSASYGVTVPVGYSPVIEAKKYVNDFEGFFAEIMKSWDEQWDLVYDTRDRLGKKGSDKDVRPYHPKCQLVEYSQRHTFVLLSTTLGLCALILGVVMYFTQVTKRLLA